ncbi:sigma-54 interaction domain-containing protein [Wukongibacter sp. M2B1]|uniref:sigma-54 interaction domain-containing protein n=1 Tax=Wukongibacter sp. M2B1 TaxID=3088895 RepID=UPI003D7BFDB5
MHNNILLKYIYSNLLTKHSEVQNGKDIDIIKDCFNLAAECLEQQQCFVFLIDIQKTIMAMFDCQHNHRLSDFENKIINIQLNKALLLQKLSRSFILQGQEQSIYLYLYKTDRLINSHYYLCILTNNENDEEYSKLLKNMNRDINSFIKFLNKYSNCSDSILMKALDSVNDGISFCDKDGYIRYINDGCCKILNIKKEELLNKRVDHLTKDIPMLLKVIESKKSIIDVEYFLRFKEKKSHLINSGYPVLDEEGNIIGAIDIFRSIERTRKLANIIAGYQAFFTFDNIIGESRKITENINLAKIFARSNENILILGESGTGKELFAQAIHNHSTRKDQPFIALNCANFPNELIDSELFGYEEGAFTGAQKGGKPGKFELASGGTLFLDEIGEMQIHLQAKLLRVLETMCINRIGGNKLINVDVRIVAATNRKLEKLVEERKFRKDLYYRLKVLCLEIPPLRERGNDILLLADYFVQKLRAKIDKDVKGLNDEAKKMFLKHNWPGNIRELENTISRALFICDSNYITEKTLLMAGMKESRYEEIIKRNTVKINREIIVDTLKLTGGNKKKTAEILGISRPTLYKVIKKYDI